MPNFPLAPFEQKVEPDDFYGDNPPPRIMGVETENSIDTTDSNDIAKFIGDKALKNLGLIRSGQYLSNGSRLYIDLNRLIEYAAPESLGPQEAAYTCLAGLNLISDIVQSSKKQYSGLYRLTGAYSFRDGRIDNYATVGTHENLLIPSSLITNQRDKRDLLRLYLPAYLISRFYAMQGGLYKDSFILSQKYPGTRHTISSDLNTRIIEGNKPMVLIRGENGDTDDVNWSKEWGRLEVRLADAVRAPKSLFLSLGTLSLMMRLIEHSQLIEPDLKYYVGFTNPFIAGDIFNSDLSFLKVVETAFGKKVSGIDIQEKYYENILKLSEKIQLPEDEIKSLQLWSEFIDQIRTVQRNNDHDITALAADYDFAALYLFLSKKHHPLALNATNVNVLIDFLRWHRISTSEKGNIAGRWWKNHAVSELFEDEIIKHYMYNSPKTRASIRGEAIKSGYAKVRSWSSITVQQDKIVEEVIKLLDPYQSRY